MSLLDDVSIVVTPNGYKAGELYAVVPVPTEGAEEVTNGDFATDSNWNKGTGITISGGSANFTGNANANINQTSVSVQGKLYKAVFTITNYVSGKLDINVGGSTRQGQLDANGTYTFIVVAQTGAVLYFQEDSSLGFVGSIDNVSVKEYTAADMDVTRATAATRVDEAGLVNYAEIVTGSDIITDGDFPNGSTAWALNGWTISNNAANCSGITANMIQTISGSTNKTYSLTFTISNYVSGNVIPAFVGGNSYSKVYNANGTFTEVISSYSDTRFVFYATSFNGSIDNVSVKEVTRDNVPRIDYSGGGCPHILAEPQRTNLYPHSDNSSTWSKSNFTTTDNYATSPDGTTNAFRGVSTSNASLLYIGSTGSAGTNTISIYAKSNTASDQKFRFFGNGNTTQSSDQTVTQEWQRFEYTETFSFVTWGLAGASVSGTNDILFYGMQQEVGSYPTSIIPTSGSTVTRNQDQFSRDGIASLINSEEGVLFLEIAALSLTSTLEMLSLSDGTYNNVVLFRYYDTSSNDIQVQVKVGGSAQASMLFTLTDATDFNKIAFKYKENDFALWVNGTEVATDTSGNTFSSSTLNKLSLDRGDGNNNLFAKVKQLQVYKTALTDEQLLQLTGESGTDFYESYAEMASALTYTIQ